MPQKRLQNRTTNFNDTVPGTHQPPPPESTPSSPGPRIPDRAVLSGISSRLSAGSSSGLPRPFATCFTHVNSPHPGRFVGVSWPVVGASWSSRGHIHTRHPDLMPPQWSAPHAIRPPGGHPEGRGFPDDAEITPDPVLATPQRKPHRP